MRILQINSVVNYGSTGHIAEDIGKLVIQKKWESVIAYGRYPRNSESKLIRVGNDFNVNLHGVISRFFDAHGFGSYFSTKKFITTLKQEKPDIIHLHNIHGYYINIKLLFKYLKKVNVPIVWTLHDCWAMTGHCSHYTAVSCFKWKEKCFKCPQCAMYPKSFIDKSSRNYKVKKELFTGLKNLTIVTPSEWLASVAKESYLKGYPVQVINNGIDLDKFYPRCQKSESCIILGVAGVWDNRKGLNDFIKLSELIKDDEEIILVGLSKDQISCLPEKIKGIERTESQEALAELYSKATVFVNPTYEDTFPTTNLEALACGTPVITYGGTGSGESVSLETGYVLSSGNVQDIYEKIQIIKEKGSNSFIKVCTDRANSLYNKDNCFNQYIKLYEKLIEK